MNPQSGSQQNSLGPKTANEKIISTINQPKYSPIMTNGYYLLNLLPRCVEPAQGLICLMGERLLSTHS